MGLGADGALRHLYWGAPLWRADDLAAPPARRDISSFDPRQMLEAEEFPGWGGPRYYEPALKITRDNGNRDLVLRYVSHRIAGNDLDIVLKDLNDPIEVTLHYRVYPEHGILRRSATIRNATQRALTVESAQSATWNLPPGRRLPAHLSHRPLGRRDPGEPRAHPRRPEGDGKPQGPHQPQFQSRGSPSIPAMPAKSMAPSGSAPSAGAATGACPSNRRPTARCASPAASTASISPTRSSPAKPWKLRPSMAASPPPASAPPRACSTASRANRSSPAAPPHACGPSSTTPGRPPPSRVNEQGQKDLAAKAAKLGVELFVMDDGWFGARNNDRAGLGDWTVNPQKFPQGLKGLIDHVNSLEDGFRPLGRTRDGQRQ